MCGAAAALRETATPPARGGASAGESAGRRRPGRGRRQTPLGPGRRVAHHPRGSRTPYRRSRRTLTGEPLDAVLPTVATAQRAGTIGAGHIAVIRSFFSYLPADIDAGTIAQAEAHLADLAAQCRPDELSRLASRLADHLHPDG